MRRIFLLGSFAFQCLFFSACQKAKEEELAIPAEIDYEIKSGGELTTFDFSENAFGHAAPFLDTETENDFVVGNSFFRTNWVAAPASASGRDGLGPIFNALSCGSCHFKDGRGLTPEGPAEKPLGLLFRISEPSFAPHPDYGDQLQNLALNGFNPEVDISVSYVYQEYFYPDGNRYTLRTPTYTFSNEQFGSLANVLVSPRIAQQLIGLGLLEAISEQSILANADPNDLNGDGISGRPNYVMDFNSGQTVLGRFGWKANQPNISQQTAAAFNGDIGITTSIFPNGPFTTNQTIYQSIPNGGDPEISDLNLTKVVLYTSLLRVPARRNYDKEEVIKGKQLFTDLGCAQCHIPSFTTSAHPQFTVLSNQKVYPYTDILLHDMGTSLADGRPDYLATGTEWRTPPLWGLGMVETVNGNLRLLHDGRARSFEEAILWHDGEGEYSKQKFKELSKVEREALIQFLYSL
jgi:CxxC motif-containing protein (DUF1111 family)